MHVVERAPELYHAYIGVSQMANQRESERRFYTYALDRFRRRGDVAMTRKLESAPLSASGSPTAAYLAIRDRAMHRLGVGTTRAMRSVLTGVVLESLRCPDYTLREKVALWRGKLSTGVSSMWREMLEVNLADRVPEVRLPVYLLHGVHDYTCSYAEARIYFDRLAAPLKGFYTFRESAHSPVFEEPLKARAILLEDVLAGTSRLADSTTV
jgi:pimeloyl-ACP methyl ester carboxylesterase